MRNILWSGLLGAALLALTACEMAPPTEVVRFERDLLGSTEVPPVVTDASGTVDATLRGNVLTVEGSFADLEGELEEVGGTPAHIHGPAGPDENAGVVFPLEVEPGDDNRSGTFSLTETLSAEERADFEAGLYYVNVHSTEYPGGELRAQLHDEPPVTFDQLFEIPLSGDEEVPPVTTDATGSAVIAVDGDELTVHGSFADLEGELEEVGGTPAHIHGPAGPDENAGVVFPLEVEPGDDDQSGTFSLTETLTEEQQADLQDGLYYVNVHSTVYPGGEIRGQIVPPGN